MDGSYYEYYKQQAKQTGQGVFVGPMIQRGYGLGSIFRNLFNFIRPILKPSAKFVGKQLLKSGSEILGDVASGVNIRDSAKERLSNAGSTIVNTAVSKFKDLQAGQGLKRKRSQDKAQSKRRRRVRRKSDIFD